MSTRGTSAAALRLERPAVVTAGLGSRAADLLRMCRPRIVVMSAAAIGAGFLLGSPLDSNWTVLAASVGGCCALVAASSVFNQVIEGRTDALMRRTSDRGIVTGRLSRFEGLTLGLILSLAGATTLMLLVNTLTAATAILTMLLYVLVYTPLKPVTSLCTTIGAIPGAMPPVLGWFAAGGQPGVEALALFAVFFVWQFPHFLAIGWLYREDYRTAGLKMLPSFTDGGERTAWIALIYAIAFVPVSALPRFVGLAGPGYLGAALVLSSGYVWLTVRFLLERSSARARQLMAGSLVCLPVLLICLVADFLRLIS
jgi:heme o synthase